MCGDIIVFGRLLRENSLVYNKKVSSEDYKDVAYISELKAEQLESQNRASERRFPRFWFGRLCPEDIILVQKGGGKSQFFYNLSLSQSQKSSSLNWPQSAIKGLLLSWACAPQMSEIIWMFPATSVVRWAHIIKTASPA